MFSHFWRHSCRHSQKVNNTCRTLATEATSATAVLPSHSFVQNSKQPILNTAIILNRSPILTRTPSAFEKAYYAYQARIHRAIQNPFPHEFYFKQGSPLEIRFNVEERRRERQAFGIPFGANEGVLKTTDLQESSLRNEEYILAPRVHQADVDNDVKSLDRSGERNLYLLLRTREEKGERWRFPQGGVEKGELLHHAAARDLEAECGVHMDAWIVSRNPIGVYHPPSPNTDESLAKTVVFFYKAHIMAGQVRLKTESVLDFAWLTKDEIGSRLDKDYWLGVKDMLSDF